MGLEAEMEVSALRYSGGSGLHGRSPLLRLQSDERLVTQIRRGNQNAFEVLVSRYNSRLLAFCRHMLGSREDAEDVLQEALLKAYCNLQQFRGNSQFYTWLVRITMNEALMNLRKRRYRQAPLEEVVETEREVVRRELEDRSNNPEMHYAEQEVQQILARAIKTLSPRLSAAFVLRNVEEMPMQEIAAVLGLSASAAKSRVVRARSRLRKRLRKLFLARAASRPEPREHTGRGKPKPLAAVTGQTSTFADASA